MKRSLLLVGVLAGGLALLASAPETPKSMAATYDTLADSILALKQTEANFVRALLDGHFHAARVYHERGEHERAAAEIALFGNEGDNAIAGVRKRLLEGGHHHHADGEAKGVYDPGFVVVTRSAKEACLAASAAMRAASDDAAAAAAWKAFAAVAEPLLAAP